MMLSRVAENLYWMARYLERGENTARLINTTTKMLLDLPRGATVGWEMLLKVVGLDEVFKQYYTEMNEANIMRFLIEDERNASSVLSCFHFARENSRTCREMLPVEFWERSNGLYLYIRENAPPAMQSRRQRYQVLNGVIERRQSLVGLLLGSMSSDQAYQFIKLGRNLERADMTTRILDVNSAVVTPESGPLPAPIRQRLWMNVLTALSAYQMYRRYVGVHVEGPAAMRFLLLDLSFPRTVQHCLSQIEACLENLPNHDAPMKALRNAWRRIAGLKSEDLQAGARHDFLDHIQIDLAVLNDAITAQYFRFHPPAAKRADELATQE